MRVIVLGGAGDMGRIVVSDLAKSDVEVTIADKNLRAAEEVKNSVEGKALVLEMDVMKREELLKTLEGYDVVVSTLGPFYAFEKMLAEVAVEAGKPYVSICDDYDAFSMVMELDGKAKERGVLVLTGLGWTPGLSNVLARLGCQRMKYPRAVRIAWAGAVNDAKGRAVMKHTFHIYSGKVPSHRDGKSVLIRAGSENEVLLFPEPIGKCEVANVGHPEPLSIPMFIKGLEEVTLKGGVTPRFVHRALIGASRLHLMDKPWQIDLLTVISSPFMGILGGKACSGLRVEVEGEGEKLVFGATANMGPLTGVPASIGAQMVGRGEVKETGVLAPEACINPERFLEELGRRGIAVYEGEGFERRIN